MIVALFVLTVTVMIGSLVVQWKSAKQTQLLVQVAITAMEDGKYNYQHFGQLGKLPEVKEPYKLVRVINSKHKHNMDVKELEVIGYYEQKEMLHFSTYIWKGISKKEDVE